MCINKSRQEQKFLVLVMEDYFKIKQKLPLFKFFFAHSKSKL